MKSVAKQKLVYRTKSQLTPWPKNPRSHSADQITELRALIEKVGFTQPIMIDEKDKILAGHGRTLAVDDDFKIPCVVLSGLTVAKKRAIVISDNQMALNAGWDEDLLSQEIQTLMNQNFDIDLLGFDDEFLNDLLAPEIDDPDRDPDDIPPITEKTKSRNGDIWILGDHRLMCGDSTDGESVDRLINDVDPDVIVIDPPYNEEQLYQDTIPIPKNGQKLIVMWDFKRFAIAPCAALNAGWSSLYEFVWDNVQSWYTPNRPLARHKALGIFGDDPFFDTENAIIKDGVERRAGRVTNTRGSYDYTPLDGAKHIATVEAFSNALQNDEHGHGKPIAWLCAIMNGIGGSVYLDLFGGSGAILIACEMQDRQCLMMELDPHYCDVIIKRWQDYTGKRAILERTGKQYNKLRYHLQSGT